MRTTINPASVQVAVLTIPDGEYVGSWSGYEVRFTVNGTLMSGKTRDGVRGTVPCIVVVEGDYVEVKETKRA